MTWLDQLELELDQRLAAFLRSNPVQEQLFRDQHQRDRIRALMRQRQQLSEEATEHRRQLLALAAEVKQPQKKPSSLEQDWALFEAQQELEELRRQAGLN